jgi:2-aminoethylphosphonate-pyruvate transaminase
MSAYKGPDGQEDMPYLLSAGPVTTSRGVKIAMLADYDAWDAEFSQVTRVIRTELKRIAGCDDTYDCVLLQGSGTSIMEAAIGSFCPARRKKTLVVCNGESGERAAQIMERIGRPFVRLAYKETTVPRASDIARTLDEDRNISHVWLAHVELSSGMLNPLQDIAQVVQARGRVMMVDALSSFGGLPLHVIEDGIDVLVSSSGSCLESTPGLAFCLIKRVHLETSVGQCHSLVLDLYAQWKAMESTGQFRFTPPTHTVASLREALSELEAEGGVEGRSKRYQRNGNTLRERLRALGLTLLLADVEASPIIQTVLAPRSATFDFSRFNTALREKGFAISAGNLAHRPSFRIGCIGKVDEKIMRQLVIAIEDVMNEMDVRSFAPGDA